MAKDAVYAKGIAKREEILTQALAIIAAEGYFGTSLRRIAEATGMSQAGLLHYFESKEDLYVEIVRRREEQDARMLGDRPVDVTLILEIVRHNAEVPGLVELFAVLAPAAANPAHIGHEFFRARYDMLRDSARRSIERAQADGEIRADVDPEMTAAILIALADGIQLQWMYDPARDMGAHVRYLWNTILGLTPPSD